LPIAAPREADAPRIGELIFGTIDTLIITFRLRWRISRDTFLNKIAEPPAPLPRYGSPSQEKLMESLLFILEQTCRTYDAVAAKYSQMMSQPTRNPPAPWAIGSRWLIQ
jgi:hypothetical protein